MAKGKIKKAIKSYVKNVAGGAKIVAGAVKNVTSGISKSSLSAAAGNIIPGYSAITNKSYSSAGIDPSAYNPQVEKAKAQTLATKQNIIRGGVTGILTTLASQPSKVATAMSNLAKPRTSGGTISNGSYLTTEGSPDLARTSSLSGIGTLGTLGTYSGLSGGINNIGLGGTSGGASNVITSTNLGIGANNTKLTFPEPKVEDYSKYIPAVTDLEKATEEKDTSLQDYLDTLINERPDSGDAYAKAQRETQILEKQQAVNDLTGKLNAIVNTGQAQQLQLVGQGRGIPEVIISGQQAQVARETAIQALPVAAQLDAAQGSLDSAEDNLNTLYQIYSKDAQNEFENKREVKKMVYEIATANEKRELEKLDKQEERDYDERQLVLKDIKDIATQAMQNQAPASVLSNIFKAKTYQEAVGVAGKYGGDYLQRELLLQQIENVKSQIEERKNTTNAYGTITGKPQTAAQSSANGYADRVSEADVIIGTLGEKFTGKYNIGGLLPNRLQSGNRQMYEQAKRNFVNAVLRRESGAAIAPSEFLSAEKQYFPQAGDKPEVVLQKEISRNTTINNLYRESNVNRPVLPGQIIESEGVRFRVGLDGETLDIIE